MYQNQVGNGYPTSGTEERMVPQSDVDRIVEERLNRERKKYKGFDSYKNIADTLRQNAEIPGETPEEIAAYVSEYYGGQSGQPRETEDDDPRMKLSVKEQAVLAALDASEFLNSAGEQEIQQEYERLNQKGKQRSDAEDVYFGMIAERVSKEKAKKDTHAGIMEFQQKYPDVRLEDLLQDDGFDKLAAHFYGPLTAAYEVYTASPGKKAKGAKPSTGSARDKSGSYDGEYFTRDEVEKMSSEQRHANYDKIKKSMSRW